MAVSPPRLVAHRGLHSDATPENTIAAIEAAIDAGLAWVEVDVQVTSDGVPVLLHDRTAQRLWGDPRTVSTLTAAQVAELGGGRRRIPTLAEALEVAAATQTRLLIDLDGRDLASAAARIVTAAGALPRVAFCGHLEAMRAIRALLPDAEIWLPWEVAAPPAPADLAAVAGITDTAVPGASDGLSPSTINAHHLLVGEEFVRSVHLLGMQVAVWTVQSPDQARHLAALGVDSITTDRPEVIAAALAAPEEQEESRRLVAVLTEMAPIAADRIATLRAAGIGEVESKANPADLVTEIDRAVERAVRDVLAAQFPDHDVVGEEYGGEPDGAQPCWYLDPVDGTANLANGLPWTSFSLALVDRGDPVAAVVLDPVGGIPIVATRGAGAWRAGERLSIPGEGPPSVQIPAGADPLAGAIVATELAAAQPWPGMLEMIQQLADRHCTVRIQGSGTATMAGVALGRGVGSVIHRYNRIDHAAALRIVLEAGGAVLDGEGKDTLDPDGVVIAARDRRTARAIHELWAATQRS